MKLFIAAVLLGFALPSLAGDTVGRRPYEMDWAGRTQDHCPPLVDFEDLAGWRAEGIQATATFECTREQQLWGQQVGKLTYRGTGPAPEVRVLPPNPIAINRPFDAVTLWCYGNNWGWATDPSTPRVSVSALFSDAAGQSLIVPLATVDWKEWSLLHRRLAPEEIERVKRGASFTGLLISHGKNSEDRVLFFDNLAVFTEKFPPLAFAPRPQRGIEPLPGQSTGANIGPGRLPFPTRSQTILPVNLTDAFTNAVTTAPGASNIFLFTYDGIDGRLTYRLQPSVGTWSDLTLCWDAGGSPSRLSPERLEFSIQPCADGGIYLKTSQGAVLPERAEHLGSLLQNGTVVSRWKLSTSEISVEVEYRYRLWNKSLVIDVLAPGGGIAEVRFGSARGRGLENPRLVTNPFYPADGGRPAVVVIGTPESPLFLTGNVDWYQSNGSILWAANSLLAREATYNGGTRYLPLTNGKRVDCLERFFLTASPRYEEVLPSIPNPPSPWRQITGTRLWRAHGASNREQDASYWTEVHRYGMTEMVVTDHETLWRDEGESFTFRTRAAPGKGGDKGAYEYARLMQDKLGFVYGPYNNFTDFAPVNEFWNFDMVSRDPNNQLQRAWMRCYAPKPARAVEYCARLAPQIQEKFQFSTAYCDVHTAVAPWHRVDYDPRVPGAGTFAAVFYSYGEIMLLQKQAWRGPVYSEGNYHAFYMGLTDGNYGQDQSYRPAENPWLVDFDLRHLHDLGCNFGMGNLEMFYANLPQPRDTAEQRDAEIDRFLAATVAFGHPGFLVMEGGYGNALRSYYMLQQLQSRYCLTNVSEIRYVSSDGQLQDTSQAVASDAFRRSQVVTRYADGTVTAANGSRNERLRCEAFGRKLDLPPNGYAGWTSDGAVEVLSSDSRGRRADYAATPAYLYVDGRGQSVWFERAAGNGPGICRFLPKDQFEIILFEKTEAGFAIEASSAVALDKNRQELGPAELRKSRGLTYVVPVKDAFSYRLVASTSHPGVPQGEALRVQGGSAALTCDRTEVVPGERVVVHGTQPHEVSIPADAKPGQHLWFQFEGSWIDFAVTPLADLTVDFLNDSLHIAITSHLGEPADFTLQAAGKPHQLRLIPNQTTLTNLNLGPAHAESAELLPIVLQSGSHTQSLELGLRTRREVAALLPLPSHWTGGMARRGQKETSDFGTSGAFVRPQSIECGAVTKTGLFMHPPWQGGPGYSFALYAPCALPAETPAAFRASVGKSNGSDPGDGILYKLVVVDSIGSESVVTQTTVKKHEWQAIEADLSPWAGQTIRLKLIADVGPKDDSSGDWSAWADMRIETLHPILHRQLERDLETLRRQAPAPLGSKAPKD